MKKGQVTVFIIIGIVALFIVGAALYLTSRVQEERLELAKPRVSEIPERAQPIRDVMENCLNIIATDGLKKLGSSGGYIDQNLLQANPYHSTEGNAVQFAPGAQKVAYWWHMESPNRCTADCTFGSQRPPLTRDEGRNSIQDQLQRYVTAQLPDCLVSLEQIPGCTVRQQESPQVNVLIGDVSVVLTAQHQITAQCEDQTYTVNDYAAEIPINLREIYELATTITNMEIESGILEQATNTVIGTFSGIDSQALPPSRGLEFGSPSQSTFWMKFDVLQKLKGLLASYIPVIQVFGARNYQYIDAPRGVRDPELYELVYNRGFLIPTNKTFPFLEARFSYLDWWEPYFDLNCNGQLCRADSLTSFQILPMTLHRYEFAYDLSYPVLLELRDPFAFNNEGYTFNVMLEQNMRSSRRFTSGTQLTLPNRSETIPSIFCNPDQWTSGEVELAVLNGQGRRPLDDAQVSYICGTNICNLGNVRNGTFLSRFPRCIGGTLQVTKANFGSKAVALDTAGEEKQTLQLVIEPIRFVNATIRNYPITKPDEQAAWQYIPATGLVRPSATQTAVVMLQRKGLPDEEPFVSVVELIGATPAELRIVPGKYLVQITSTSKADIVFPPKERCFSIKKIFSKKEKCQNVPEKPLVFNATSPFPLGLTEFEWLVTPEELQDAKNIEFRQYVLAIEKTPEEARTIEDLEHMSDPQLYTESNFLLVRPVISK